MTEQVTLFSKRSRRGWVDVIELFADVGHVLEHALVRN